MPFSNLYPAPSFMTNRLVKIWAFCSGLILLTGCAAGRHAFNPDKKYPKEQLQRDYILFRNILEQEHPSLYWYTSKDSLDRYFDATYLRIRDSMTEPQFRTLLSYVVSKMNCGHTTVRASKKWARYQDTGRLEYFPLSIKFWKDSAVVYDNLNRYDSVLTQGTLLTSIDHHPVSFYRDSLFQFISADGYAVTHKYQTLSNRGGFAAWFKNVFGLPRRIPIGYVNRWGKEETREVLPFTSKTDSTQAMEPFAKLSRKEKKQLALYNIRNLQIDTALSSAYCTLNTFQRGSNLTGFIRSMFKILHRHQIRHLVLDLRSNGGGNVSISNLLTRYITDHPFKLADSLYAVTRKSQYSRYIQNHFRNRLTMNFITRKQSDGKYHFGYFEHHYFKPRRKDHYDGNVYVITGGNTFSATTLFADIVKGQKNVLLVGEETGGGAYGNTAWMIPDVTLPNTKVRFRLPMFRMVINKDFEKGKGVLPDIFVSSTLQSIRNGEDPKMEKVKELISGKKNSVHK